MMGLTMNNAAARITCDNVFDTDHDLNLTGVSITSTIATPAQPVGRIEPISLSLCAGWIALVKRDIINPSYSKIRYGNRFNHISPYFDEPVQQKDELQLAHAKGYILRPMLPPLFAYRAISPPVDFARV